MAKIPAYKQMYISLKTDIKRGAVCSGVFSADGARDGSQIRRQPHDGAPRNRHAGAGRLSVRHTGQRNGGSGHFHFSASESDHLLYRDTETPGISRDHSGICHGEDSRARFCPGDLSAEERGSGIPYPESTVCGRETGLHSGNYLMADLIPGFSMAESDCVSLYACLENQYGIILKNDGGTYIGGERLLYAVADSAGAGQCAPSSQQAYYVYRAWAF